MVRGGSLGSTPRIVRPYKQRRTPDMISVGSTRYLKLFRGWQEPILMTALVVLTQSLLYEDIRLPFGARGVGQSMTVSAVSTSGIDSGA